MKLMNVVVRVATLNTPASAALLIAPSKDCPNLRVGSHEDVEEHERETASPPSRGLVLAGRGSNLRREVASEQQYADAQCAERRDDLHHNRPTGAEAVAESTRCRGRESDEEQRRDDRLGRRARARLAQVLQRRLTERGERNQRDQQKREPEGVEQLRL